MKFMKAALCAAIFIFTFASFPFERASLSILRAEEVDTQDLGEIEVIAPVDQESAAKPSGFVNIIDPKPFVNKVKTLPEILSQQAGVNVQQYGGLGQYSTVSIRGSTAEQVTVLLDGVKLNTAQGGAVDFSSIPLDAIDRIEIIRGGATTQFGSDAIGGVVNIITKKARKKQSFELSGGGGSFQTLKENLGYARQFKNWSLLFNQTHMQSAGDFSFITTPTIIGGVPIGGGQEYIRENNSFWSENGLLKFEGDPHKKLHLSLTTDWFGSHRQVPPTEDEVILFSPSNLPEARENLLKNYTSFKADIQDVGTQGLSLHLQPFFRYEYSHFQDPSPALGAPINVKNYDKSFGGQMAWDYSAKTGPAVQLFKFNYEIKRELFDNSSPIGNPVPGFHARTTNGVFLSDEASFLEEALLVNPSFRYEHTNDFGSRVSGHLGLRGKPTSWAILKTNIENSFRYPNFNELYFPNEGIIRGNPNLRPESALNFDIGANFIHKYGSHEIAFFYNRIENSIIYVPISPFTIAPVNTDRVNAYGLEVSTTLTPWEHLDFTANYTYLHAELVSTGQQLPGRPRQKLNATLTLKNKWGSVYGTLQFIDDLPIDFQNTTFLNARAQVNVGMTLNFLQYWHFALEVKDVNNIQMLDARGFPLPRLSALATLGVRI